jgi:hypothetical protein
MKKTMKKISALMAVMAFAVLGLTSCGGEKGGESEANDIPTDGLLGELPMLTAKYCNKIVDLREKIFSGQLTEKEMQEARAEFDETEKERDAKILLARQALNGTQVPVEVQEGLPIKVDGTLTIESEGKGSIFAVGKGVFQKDFTYDEVPTTCIVPIDTDGKAIKTGRGGLWYAEDGKTSLMNRKNGTKFVINANVSVGSTSANKRNTSEMKRCAKLAKFVIMNSTTDAYKKLEEQLEADKKAEEIEAAKAVVGEK